MTNRFKRSIESLETAAENPPLQNGQTAPDMPPSGMGQPPANTVKMGVINDFLDDIEPTRRRGMGSSIYLTNEVLEAVTQIAAQRRISKSKVVDKVLRQVLKIE